MTRRRQPIVGRAVRPQTVLRPVAPMRDLDEFLAFLGRMIAVLGRDDRPRRPTTGARFRL